MTYGTINDAQTIVGNGEGTLLAGRYRIVRQLGQGGMGSVWLAEDTQLDNKPFAIKMLPSILVSNKRAYNQLKAEALVAMQLVHPNIVQIRAFEENNCNPFLVMDYIDGQTLDDYLADNGSRVERVDRVDENGGGARRPAEPVGSSVPRDRDGRARSPSGLPGGLPESDVLRILRPIAAALDYAHGEGVVHRDVKPANVMIRKDGHPFILDFGIAREIQETMTRVTGKLSSGTLLYMSPEQLMGEPPKPAQDIYSFAAMAYECLKGEPPFSHGQIEFQIMNKQPAPLATDALTGKAAILAAGVMSGLAKKPEDRPASCTAVLEGKDFSRVERVDRVDGIGGARRPAEPLGARAPRPPGGPRPVAAVKAAATLKVAALIAALAGGAWWFVNARAARFTGTTGVSPVVTPPPTGTGVSPVVTNAPTGTTGVPPVVTEADVTEIVVEATVQKARMERLDDADGFLARKNSLADTLVRATAYGKAKRWAEAAQGFTNYVGGCKALLALDVERHAAKKSQAEAEAAKNCASEAEALQYAETRWNAAIGFLEAANDLFGKMMFADATSKYAAAAKQFDLCVGEAKAERKRQEDEAAAKAKAEQEKREREAAEVKARAEREARERQRCAKWRKEGEEFTINDPNGLYMTMKWCPAGTFTMGSPMSEEGRYDNERQHEVTLTKGFWMGQTEVTQGQWKRLMDGETIVGRVRKSILNFKEFQQMGGNRPSSDSFYEKMILNSTGESDDSIAIYHVNWYEAVEFCKRLTERERAKGFLPDGYEYRLPTETEWEYACRAGTTTALPNGKELVIINLRNAPNLNEIAWYGGNSSVGFQGKGFSTLKWEGKQFEGGDAYVRRVMQKQPNKFGLYDMIGNVSELCFDSTSKTIGGKTYDLRITRGGGWQSAARCCRSAYSGTVNSRLGFCTVGFRVALAPSH